MRYMLALASHTSWSLSEMGEMTDLELLEWCELLPQNPTP
jgi:hypothetical protein